MITFFSHPRAFVGEFAELQPVAIQSWMSAVPGCEVILMGSQEGTKEMAEKLGLHHKPSLPSNRHETVLINAMFYEAEMIAKFPLLCEISADIILGGDVYYAIKGIIEEARPFVVGQRWDIDKGATADKAILHPPSAADYFIYRKGTLGEIPAFAIGRTAYDNWFIWAAIHKWDLKAIDATMSITAVHINHSYPEYGNKALMLQSEERKRNHRLAAETGCNRWYGINDAPYVLNNGRIERRA